MTGPIFDTNLGPPREAWCVLTAYHATIGGPEYIGKAKPIQPAATLTASAVSKASAAQIDFSANHGLGTGNTIEIVGATGDWAAMNGTLIVTYVDADSVTVPIASTGFSGSFNGTITTTSPQSTKAQWAIERWFYNSSSQVERRCWATGDPSPNQIWDNRSTLSYR